MASSTDLGVLSLSLLPSIASCKMVVVVVVGVGRGEGGWEQEKTKDSVRDGAKEEAKHVQQKRSQARRKAGDRITKKGVATTPIQCDASACLLGDNFVTESGSSGRAPLHALLRDSILTEKAKKTEGKILANGKMTNGICHRIRTVCVLCAKSSPGP